MDRLEHNKSQAVVLSPIVHFAVSVGIAVLVVLSLKNPDEVDIPPMPAMAFTLLLVVIIEAVSVATDKADLLNRLREE